MCDASARDRLRALTPAASCLGAIGALALLGGFRGPPDKGAAEEAFTTEVIRGELPIEVELSGRFVAEDKDEIRLEPEAYKGDLIITMLKAEGASVKKGDVLMEFDPSTLERALDDARIDFEQLTQLYQERELHTATENILIARERRQIANRERSLEKTKREVEIWKKYDRKRPVDEKDLHVTKKQAGEGGTMTFEVEAGDK